MYISQFRLCRTVAAIKREQRMLLALLITALASTRPQAAAAGDEAAACQRRCGGLEIPPPFGIGRGCYLDTGDGAGHHRPFEVTCSGNGTAAVDGFEVLGFDVRRGKVRVRSRVSSWCYDAASGAMGAPDAWSYDSAAGFRVSGTENLLTVVGCDVLAYIGSREGGVENRYVVGCHAACPPAGARSLANGSGSGAGDGWCQTPIQPGTRSFGVAFYASGSYKNRSGVAGFSPCGYAMLVEAREFEFRTTYVTTNELMAMDAAGGGQLPMVLDWAVGNQTCETARRNKTAFACVSANSECVDSKNGGYLCNCSTGYQGNPYRVDGCQDIDECNDKEVEYPCPADTTCRNTPGGHRCLCPPGRRRAESGCEIDYSMAAIGTSIGVVLVAVGLSFTYAFQEKKRLAAVKRRHFAQHGGGILFEEMKSRQWQGLSFTLFTRDELEEATNGFDERHVLGKGGNGTVYRGELRDGRTVAIKRCRVADDERRRREFGKEMLILSQVNHRSVVKLHGCCLEVEVPMLVYEFIPNGTLYQLIHAGGDGGDGGAAPPPPPLAVRLRIAHEAAEALAYLHSTASPPIIHGDVKSPNILLDEGLAAKVSDFGAAALAANDEVHVVTLVRGTCGYLDPEYMQTCRLTDRSDVYSFGVVLLELLTGRRALALAAPEAERSLAACFLAAARGGRLDELVDARIKGEVSGEVLDMVAGLARRCLEMSGEKRPAMRDVAEELGRIRKLCQHGACLD